MACEDCAVVKDALIKTLEALIGWLETQSYGFLGARQLGAPIHEALLRLKGETELPKPKRAILSPEAAAVLCSNGELVFQLGHSIYRKAICLSPEETKRLTSFLKDGE